MKKRVTFGTHQFNRRSGGAKGDRLKCDIAKIAEKLADGKADEQRLIR